MAQRAIFGPPVDEPAPGGFVLSLDVVTMVGHEYVLFRPEEKVEGAEWWFPWDFFGTSETPAEAAKRVVEEWTGTRNPKLEIADFVHVAPSEGEPGRLGFVFRAMLVEDPRPGDGLAEMKTFPRGGLPERVGLLEGRAVEEALKSSLAYKLTRQ